MPETVFVNTAGVLESFDYTFIPPLCLGYQNTTLLITAEDTNGVELNQDPIVFIDC